MRQKAKVSKTSIFITLFVTTVLMCVVSAVSAVFLYHIAVTSFSKDCREFDSAMDKLAIMTQEQVTYKKKLLNSYARILQNAKDDTVQNMLDGISREEDTGFEAFYYAGAGQDSFAGKGVPLTKKEIETAKEALYGEGKTVKGEALYLGISEEDRVFYAVPCIMPDANDAILVGFMSARIAADSFDKEMSDQNSVLYLLNEQNQVAMYSGGQGHSYNYESMSGELIYSEIRNTMEHFAYEPDVWLGMDRREQMRFFLQGEQYIWYEKAVFLSEGEEWKLIAGKKAVLSPESLVLIKSSAILVAFVIIVSFLLMVGLVISQGKSNYRLGKLAYVDFVTEHHNWTKFQIDAKRLLGRKKKNSTYVLVSLDIRKFRVISDMYGEAGSDAILKETANILKKQLGRKERFCRFSVDEFALLLKCSGDQVATERISHLHCSLKESCLLTKIDFCYGIYPITDTNLSIQKMYNYAGIARDTVKNNREQFMGIFNTDMHKELIREKEMESCMEEALRKEEFQVYLQPKYSADGIHVGGAEALVRWSSPELGFISPGAFIPLFEKNGFILKLDMYMLCHVCELQKKWLEEGRNLIAVSVNLSRMHLLDSELVEEVTCIIASYGIPASSIELELTESAFFEDKSVLLDTVRRLKGAGFCISMDDFGSGYSSLNSLKDLPLDVVKLDGEFFRETDNKGRSETVIRDTISLAKHLDMKIVAEGIETEEQVNFLREIGCDLIQGYYFARPMPVSDFEKLMGYL